MTTGENIRTIRKQKGISQQKLADLSGIGIASIQRIEYGQFTPKKETVHKIAKALEVEDTDLDDSLKEMIRQKTNLSAFTTDELLEEIKRRCR